MRSSADWSSAIVHLCKASSGPFSPSLPPTHSLSQLVHGNAVNGRENNKLHSFQGIIITSITEQFHSQRVDDDETTTHYQRRRRPGWQQKNRRMCRIELLFHYWEFPNHLRVMCAERGAREEETLPASEPDQVHSLCMCKKRGSGHLHALQRNQFHPHVRERELQWNYLYLMKPWFLPLDGDAFCCRSDRWLWMNVVMR